MKKMIAFCLLFGFLISFLPLQAQENLQESSKTEVPGSRKFRRQQKKEAAKIEAAETKDQSKAQKKREIEAKEHAVDKTKKVKKFSTDKDLPETVRKRNIP